MKDFNPRQPPLGHFIWFLIGVSFFLCGSLWVLYFPVPLVKALVGVIWVGFVLFRGRMLYIEYKEREDDRTK